jgi:hypothetical protein
VQAGDREDALARRVSMVDWGLVAVIIAICCIPLFIAETPVRLLVYGFRKTKKKIWPNDGYCERLTWDDIPDNTVVHKCEQRCLHVGHNRDDSCWKSTVEQTFNTVLQPRQVVPKPDQLYFSRRYLRTDLTTLLAFILITVGEKVEETYGTADVSFGYKADSTSVRIRDREGVLVVHVHGHFKEKCQYLTKLELENMVRHGYPPFYRERVKLEHGPMLLNPMSPADIERGGWIIAAGLSKVKPTMLYMVPGNDTTYERRGRSCAQPFRNAVQRVFDTLVQHIQDKFPENTDLESVINGIRYMLDSGSQSGAERYLPGNVPLQGGEPSRLNGRQCAFALRMFNEFKPLTREDESELEPILTPVLNAAFYGTLKLITYLKETGLKFVIPPLLLERHNQPIYLEDCSSPGYVEIQ